MRSRSTLLLKLERAILKSSANLSKFGTIYSVGTSNCIPNTTLNGEWLVVVLWAI